MTPGRMTYHLRRLRLHGLIERIPHTHRYTVNDFGLNAAVVLHRAHARFTATAMADLATNPRGDPDGKLRRAIANLDRELDRIAKQSGFTLSPAA